MMITDGKGGHSRAGGYRKRIALSICSVMKPNTYHNTLTPEVEDVSKEPPIVLGREA